MALNTQTITLAKAEGDTCWRGTFTVEGDFAIKASFGRALLVGVGSGFSGSNKAESWSGVRSDLADDFGYLIYPRDIEITVQDDDLEEAPQITVLSNETITTE